ncbi:MAG: hypothetical protein JWP31_523 [Aeromicrobium sp.]|nr:hypothetical protein [Aeromicrobium sp.]
MSVSRTGWALSAISATVIVVLVRDVPDLMRAVGGPSFPDAGIALVTLGLIGLSAWIVLITALSTVGASHRVLRAVSPAAMRRLVLTGAVGVVVLAPTQMHATPSTDDRSAPTAEHSLAGLRLPDRPIADAPGATRDERPRQGESKLPSDVTVVPGDTLWSIAARWLGSGASDTEIARASAAWHDANREAIGDDPDLIFPSQRLTSPTGKDLP